VARTVVYLVRHGETPGNRIRRFRPYDTPLSDRGKQQARLVAERLAADGPFAALFASDLARTMETAGEISRRLGLPIVPEPRSCIMAILPMAVGPAVSAGAS
jgi:2,3-bisphosphoglycerate-dependent phosphoglycerate mutase